MTESSWREPSVAPAPSGETPAERGLIPAPEVSVEAKWWGYQVHLNQDAVDLLDELLDEIKERLKKVFKNPELREAIAIAIKLKRMRLKNVTDRTGSNGCRLVSPWVVPFALTVVRERKASQEEDLNLWFACWDEQAGTWSEDTEFHEVMSKGGPALAQHGDRLYCVHRGGDDQYLWWTTYTTNEGWSDDQRFPYQQSAATPCLVEFNGTLYCFFRGGADERIWVSTLLAGGNSWSDGQPLQATGEAGLYTPSGLSGTVLNGSMYLVYQHAGDNRVCQLVSQDGSTWRSAYVTGSNATSDTPAIAAYYGKLYIAHRGHDKDESIYFLISEDAGVSWSWEKLNARSSQGPALAVFGNGMCLVHRACTNDGHLWWCWYEDARWTSYGELPNHCTGETPALCVYTDPQCTAENYEDSSTAAPKLMCVHRGWGPG